MENSRFDALSRRVGQSGTRRAALGLLVGGIATAALPGAAAVAGKKKRCATGLKKCGKKCCGPEQPDCVHRKCGVAACPGDSYQFCNPGVTPCGPGCDCATAVDGRSFCADCALCFTPECQTDADCLAHGLPAGTVCGDGTGEFCHGCTKVCLTPCGSCANCACFTPGGG